MSAEENKALARRGFEEVWSRGNLDLADELLAADFVGRPGGETIRGREAAKEYVARMRAAFPDITFTIEDQIAEGDMVATRWTATGTHEGDLMGVPPTGKQVTVTGITIQRFADGKVAEGWTSLDTLGMLQQVGAVPAPAQA